MKGKNVLLLFHKPLDQVDGQTKYLKELIDVVSSNYKVVIPSEKFYTSFKWQNRNWLLRTFLVNIYLIKWVIKNRVYIEKNFFICIIEDRYSLIPTFILIKLTKLKLISRLSDWGEGYSASLTFKQKYWAYPLSILEILYKRFVLNLSTGAIVPSEYVFLLLQEEFHGKIFNFPHPYSPVPYKLSTNNFKPSFKDDAHDIYCALIGNFNYAPNEDSANFLLKDLALKINKVDDKIKILIIGNGSAEKFSNFNSDNIKILGLLENLSEIYQHCQIGINPSQTLGGTSIKNIEYLTNGLIVI